MPNEIRDNSAASRYELETNGATAFVTYRVSNSAVTLVHTEVPKALEGHGVGSALIKSVLDLLRSQNRKLVVICPFVAAYIRKHREYESMLAAPLPDEKKRRLDARLDEALAETFPASDATAVSPDE